MFLLVAAGIALMVAVLAGHVAVSLQEDGAGWRARLTAWGIAAAALLVSCLAFRTLIDAAS